MGDPKDTQEHTPVRGAGEQDVQRVTIVVINFNGRHHLEACLRSVQAAEGPIAEVILVDDGSTDGSADLIEAQFPQVRVIRLGHNQGPAAARNAGIEAAKTSWVCLLDNDVVVERGWLTPLIEVMVERQDVAICSSRILVYERPEIIGSDGDDAHFLGMPTQRNAWRPMSEIDASVRQEVGATLGISCLIDKSRTKEAAYFDPDFYYNFEELDLCLRNRILGYRCFVVPQSIVYHKYLTGGVADLSSNQVHYTAQRAYYVFRNRWFVVLKLYSLRTLVVLGPALLLFELVTVLFAAKNRVFKSYLRAWASIVQNLPGLLRKRRTIQASRAVPDGALLSACRLTLGRGTVQSVLEGRLVSFQGYWYLARPLL
jgi:GT2 family glycosyltransferase